MRYSIFFFGWRQRLWSVYFSDSTAIFTESRRGFAHFDWLDWVLPWRLLHLVMPTSLMRVAWSRVLSPALGFWARASSFAVTEATMYTG